MNRKRDNRRYSLVATLLLALVAGCGSRDSRSSGKETDAVPSTSSTTALPKRSGLIPVGGLAPDFEATDHQGRSVRLGELLKSGRVVLVFYPKDNTPVCTQQLCALRDDWSKFQERNVAVLGINPAGKDSHAAFASKHGFPFPVLADQDSRIAAAYGAGGLLFTKRTVYVIDRDGKVLLGERGVVPHDRIFAVLDRR